MTCLSSTDTVYGSADGWAEAYVCSSREETLSFLTCCFCMLFTTVVFSQLDFGAELCILMDVYSV